MEALKELEFINKIEDSFPFENYLHCIKLIDEAVSISSNSVFAIIDEIAKMAGSDSVSDETLVNLLKHIDKKFEHPLRKLLLETAQNIIFGEKVSIKVAIANMEKVRKYPKQYAALSTLYFSVPDKDGQLEKVWNSITDEWNKNDDLFEEEEHND